MKKLLIVFCLVTMLTLLFACNGVPALAETDDADNNTATPAAIEQTTEEGVVNNVLTPAAIEQTTENGANTKTSKPEKAKKKEAKKSKKAKKKVKTVSIMKYVKKGVFDYESYSNAVKSFDEFYNGAIVNFAFGNYVVEISTSLQYKDKSEYYIGVGTLDTPYPEGALIYAASFRDWKGSILVDKENGITVPKNGLLRLEKVIRYVKGLKNPDPFQKPEIKGFNFLEWKGD